MLSLSDESHISGAPKKEPEELTLWSLTSETLQGTVESSKNRRALVPLVTKPGRSRCEPAAALQRGRIGRGKNVMPWVHMNPCCNKILFRSLLERRERVPPYFHANSYNLTPFPLEKPASHGRNDCCLQQRGVLKRSSMSGISTLLMPDRGGYFCLSYVCSFYLYHHERCFRQGA